MEYVGFDLGKVNSLRWFNFSREKTLDKMRV